MKPLKEVLKDLESIPNIEWIDLQKETNEVKMKDIHITTNKDGIHVEKTNERKRHNGLCKTIWILPYTWFLHHCLSIVIKTCKKIRILKIKPPSKMLGGFLT